MKAEYVLLILLLYLALVTPTLNNNNFMQDCDDVCKPLSNWTLP